MYVNVNVHLTLRSHILENCATNGYKAVSYTRVLWANSDSSSKQNIDNTYTYHAPYLCWLHRHNHFYFSNSESKLCSISHFVPHHTIKKY